VNTGTLSNAYSTIIGSNDVAGHYAQIHAKSTGQLAYYVNGGTGSVAVDPGSATLTAGVWYHIGLAYDSINGLKTYVNGVSDGTAGGVGTISSATVAFRLGYDPQTAGRHFPGTIADGALWNTNLTTAEFLALSKGARPGTIRPGSLMVWQPLDGIQSPEPDLSGNKKNGTLTGTAPAFGPPIVPFTPRWPQAFPPAAAPTFNPAWALGKNIVIEGVAT
jgi:hypothetical protein